MLRGGVTCFNDMYFFPEAAAEAALQCGMRAAVGIIVVEFPSPYASDAGDYLTRGLAMRDALRDEALLSFCIAPHAPYSVSDASFERVGTYAAELDLPVHLHLHETHDELAESIKVHHERPIRRMQRLGLLGPGLIAVHAVHLEADEIELLAAEGCHVAHCPTSNLKLGSGLAPVSTMQRAGINVGLGTDGAASNNRLDIFAELRLAALLAKGASGDPTALPAHTALEMATINGARALGLDDRIGSIRPGKRADLVAVDAGTLELAPCYDPISHLVYVGGREHVSHVWVDGRLRVKDRALVGIDSGDIKAKAAYWREKIQS
jgi:5-methylthioadenosine/S-adenosylhomocysteine deaminase